DEILLGCRRAVVDLLGPPFERQLDGEGLVDREGDVEEVESVDAQIVDRMTLRADLVARDVACLGDDAGHGVECRWHRHVSEGLTVRLASPDRRKLLLPVLLGGFPSQKPAARIAEPGVGVESYRPACTT